MFSVKLHAAVDAIKPSTGTVTFEEILETAYDIAAEEKLDVQVEGNCIRFSYNGTFWYALTFQNISKVLWTPKVIEDRVEFSPRLDGVTVEGKGYGMLYSVVDKLLPMQMFPLPELVLIIDLKVFWDQNEWQACGNPNHEELIICFQSEAKSLMHAFVDAHFQ